MSPAAGGLLASRGARFFCGAAAATVAIIGAIHWTQRAQRAAMREGPLRDEERYRRKLRQLGGQQAPGEQASWQQQQQQQQAPGQQQAAAAAQQQRHGEGARRRQE